MKYLLILLFFSYHIINAQVQEQDSTKVYKKRVLENAELDFLSSYYSQDGDNAAVTGGIGTEELTDLATDIVVAIPLNDDDVLTINATASAYTSASSSNLNPFDNATPSPWVESSGSSQSDVWFSANFDYSHSSDDRNKIWSAHANFAVEYDYTSVGFGGSHTWLFNEKNTEFGIKGNVYLDTWNPRTPAELNPGFFRNTFNEDGELSNNQHTPFRNDLVTNKSRNTFAGSFSFSQILSKKAQFSLFFDIIEQDGWLSNPLQRVYFADKADFFVGNPASIPNYTSTSNRDVFQLADDIERLPSSRLKTPIGMRFNYYLNEAFVLKTYYRYYTDDWGVDSHTVEVELPIKIAKKFTLYPSYRYFTQTQADYFAPYNANLSTQEFYTSDYDLSDFDANQYSFGIRYTDIFTKIHISKLYLKQVDLKYSHYDRSTGLTFDIVTLGFKYIIK